MSILFSGDFHAGAADELSSITKKSLKKKYGHNIFNDIKYHIILGDGGFMWPGNYETDLFNYEVLAYRLFPILCVIGNHEPILGMNKLPEVDIGIGEKVYQIQDKPFVAYLKRGKVYTIDGFKFLVLGGAFSIDKNARTPNVTWWKQEYWSEKEKRDVFKLLEKENVFDCVLSHTGPDIVNKILFQFPGYLSKIINDDVARLNDQIDAKIQCKDWWCGHWHRDVYYYSMSAKRGYQYLYRATKILDRVDGAMTVYSEYGKTGW